MQRESFSSVEMSKDMVRAIVKSAIAACDKGGEISFLFQGGEPLLAGTDYYRYFINCVETLKTPDIRVNYVIQTNGILIDTEWTELFYQNKFLIGLSMDGFRELHDLHRVNTKGEGSWKQVHHALQLLQKARINFNIMCVVTKGCARSARKVYRSLVRLGLQYLQFIPCLDSNGEPRGGMSYSLSPEEYGSFLCSLFDEWYIDWQNGNYISIRLFDDYVHILMGMPNSTCSLNGSCGGYIAIENDGSVYPCDFFMSDRFRIGTIREAVKMEELFSLGFQRMHCVPEAKTPAECLTCEWRNICYGGCIRDRYINHDQVRNYFCQSFKTFFSYTIKRLCYIADQEAKALACINNKVKNPSEYSYSETHEMRISRVDFGKAKSKK